MLPSEIRSLRHALGVSTDEFASMIGLVGKNRAVTIYRWETGRRLPGQLVMDALNELAGANQDLLGP